MVVGRLFIMRVISVIRTVGRLNIVKGILGMTGVIRRFIMEYGGFFRDADNTHPPGGVQ